MNRKLWPLGLFLVLTACNPAPMPPDVAHQPSDLTAEQVLARYQAARGGAEKLRAVQSVQMTGTWGRTANAGAPITVMIAPGHYRRQIGQGARLHSIKTVAGQTNWEFAPGAGIARPEVMVAEDAVRFQHLADPQGPLLDPEAKGNKVEMVGKMPWKSTEVYKLKVTFPDDHADYFYLDAKSFLPVRAVGSLYLPQTGRQIPVEYLYEDYRDVNGVKWPFTEKADAPEGRIKQVVSWKKIEVGPQPLDPSLFKASQI
jgi:hypothetical protein